MRLRRLNAALVLTGLSYCSAVPMVPLGAHEEPDIAQVLSRIAVAAGGPDAEKRVTSRISTGFVVTPGGRAPTTVYQKAPDRFLIVIESPVGGLSRNGFDGATAWSENRKGVVERQGPEVGFFRREHSLHREIRLRALFKTLSIEPRDEADGRSLIGVRAVSADGLVERFLFDPKSYLLARHEVEIDGKLLRTEFEDYRDIDGIPVAHRVNRSRPDFSWATEFREVRQNVPIDESSFVKPAAR